MNFTEQIFEALSTIFEDENQDDVIKLRGLEFDGGIICLDVETHRSELDFFTKISLLENGLVQIEGFDDVITITPDFDSPEDTAYQILNTISTAAEDEEDFLEE